MTETTKQSTSRLRKDQIEGVRKKAHANASLLLGKLGFRGVDQGDRLVGCCPIPHGDGKTPNDNKLAFNWLFDRGIWACFTNHCEQAYGKDIFALVRCIKGFDGAAGFYQSVQHVCELLDVNQDEIPVVNAGELDAMRKMIQKNTELKRHATMEEDMMVHLRQCDYLVRSRGFNPTTVETFRAGGSWHRHGTNGFNRLIIPVYDPLDGYLIAFTGRTLLTSKELADYLEQGKRIAKWYHCINFAAQFKRSSERTDAERFFAGHVLFNLHKAKDHMGPYKSIVLVEGPLDVMRLWEAGVRNAVAVFGTSLSTQQKELLHKVGARRLVPLFDSDEAGRKAAQRVTKLCGNYFEIEEKKLPAGSDPGDLDVAELRLLFKE